jgi:hypothetical protein
MEGQFKEETNEGRKEGRKVGQIKEETKEGRKEGRKEASPGYIDL